MNTDLHTLDDLRAALAYPDPPALSDPDAIIARGRRQRLTRRLSVTGGGLLATIASVATVAALATNPGNPPGAPPFAGPDLRPAGAAPVPVLVAAVSRPVAAAPERFDPRVRTLSVGWVPAGLTNETAETTVDSQMYAGFDETYGRSGDGTTRDNGLVVTVLAKGRPVGDLPDGALGLPRDWVAHPTDPINGAPAQCLADPLVSGSCSALLWQYAPGAWARVSYAGGQAATAAGAAAVARAVAESVTLTEGDPVRLPFTVSGALASAPVERTLAIVYHAGHTGPRGEAWVASATYTGGLTVEVFFSPADPSGRIDKDSPANTTVGGQPAWLSPDHRELVVWNVFGTRVSLSYEHDGNPRTAFHDVHVLASSGDPRTWA
jgi:hypothetical protein